MSTEKLTKSLKYSLLLGILIVFPMTGVHAASLAQAKTEGMVCEMPTGYLAPTSKATAEVKQMVNEINKKRQAEYARIATQHKVTPEQVGKLTAQKLQPKCP
ncbi:MAG: YdbL family protein [Arenicellales bacterium]|jgi:hypothetical protein